MPTYQRSQAATCRRLRTGMILAVPGSGSALQLNETGAVVWELLKEPAEALWVAHRLASRFARSHAEVGLTVEQLLADLVAAGAVVRR